VQPDLGDCRVYLPATSALRTAGTSMSYVGANIVFRYQDGQLSTMKLWDFPCGALGAGNDKSESSCTGVQTVNRLNVGTNSCPPLP
jgi:hypothetical protein